ncbi:hypothetical protein [Spiroplasma poulsonii]|uniref:hypothetical protein n=1 Tax=Spiroplasma poulsonii TaxID=2138 RepID=UPI001F4C7CE8|nr:hypothetical protein [Spiroplasma poulsonii]UNF62503.1 hypothetical protein MNU24_03325 [Spiroplasma poulsonii]
MTSIFRNNRINYSRITTTLISCENTNNNEKRNGNQNQQTTTTSPVGVNESLFLAVQVEEDNKRM